MALLKHVAALVIVLACAGARAEPVALEFQTAIYGPPPAHASLYSFSDVFRLTVAGAAMGDYPLAAVSELPALAEAQVRVTSSDPAAGYVFGIRPVPGKSGWILVLAGLAAAFWVARRRLNYPI